MSLLTIISFVPITASAFYNAGSVLVMDADTGAVLYETQGFARRYPASITKVMTALIVLEEVEDLNERIIFSENAVTLPHYAGRMGVEAGESMTILEALYGIMLPSANDIARGLAEHVSGSIYDFVAQMNMRAEELGAHNTRFVNPCGLPGSGQFVTAYDIALIMREAIKNPLFVRIISTPYFDLPPSEFYEEVRTMRNSNLMIRPSRAEFNHSVIGGKTGFTNAAQHTLVTYATHEDREIIISVLYTSPRGAIFSDTAVLIDHIFFGSPIRESEIIAKDTILEEITETEEAEIGETETETEEITKITQVETHDYMEAVPAIVYITPQTYVPEIIPSRIRIYEPESREPEQPESQPSESLQEISNTHAAAVASLSIAITSAALLLIWLLYKKTSVL